MAEIVKEKQATFTPGGKGASIQEELHERRAAIEQERKEREQPRKDFMLGKGGKASDHFELVTNRETVERFTNQDGAPQSVEELSESAREKWLRTGELPERRSNGKAAAKKEEPQAPKPPERPKLADYRGEDGQIDNERYEQALDRYEADKTEFAKQQAEQKNAAQPQGEIDKETFEEFKKERQDFWNEAEHSEAHKTFPDRMVRVIQALTPAEKQILVNSPVGKLKLHGDLDGYLGHALSRVKNLGRVLVVLNKDVPLMERINGTTRKRKAIRKSVSSRSKLFATS
jgi:hypothetical protein